MADEPRILSDELLGSPGAHATAPVATEAHETRHVSPAEHASHAEEFFDLDGSEGAVPADTFKIGLLGGKQVGKSYLFQSMVYRARGRDTGALSYYLSNANIRVYGRRYWSTPGASTPDEKFRPVKTHLLVKEYEHWERLGTTSRSTQMRYRVHLPFRTGWLGRRRAEMEVRFLDGSGDHLQSGIQTEQDRKLWTDAFVDATVVVLCLPMWAAFPNPDLSAFTDRDVTGREEFLQRFHDVVHTYEELRRASQAKHRVRVIIALTQADAPLCDPVTQRAWITPFVRNPNRYLRQLRTGGGIARYLASARAVSAHLRRICESTDEKHVSSLLNLDYGYGPPWLIPVTAIDGTQLNRIEERALGDAERLRIGRPVPAHVELPLLIALSEQYNALA